MATSRRALRARRPHAGHRFGGYGHTVMKDGIYRDTENGIAMIDALGRRQFLEMILNDERLGYSISSL